MSKRIIRLPEVKAKTGLSRSSIYLRMKQGTFPHSISLGDRAIGWAEHLVEEWLEERMALGQKKGGAS
ncbi:helix-turn-helix transcriptional regulator [Vibrio alfacsensis]|uniref:helix-turn-helix transcriptional regulator n=1 Tax=Vibrio alfacsensis TaxID=1074311 RepID=UPI0040695738